MYKESDNLDKDRTNGLYFFYANLGVVSAIRI